ncbi:MAG: hypothetical protein JWO93_296, partial [Micrococcaceae bacterium]|nr:hypothetical protein [Micrococcaceae bacterium]
HKQVLTAIAGGGAEAARSAMDAHISQTFEDYEHYLLATDPTEGPP